MTKLTKHFSSHEFTCHHCGELPKGMPNKELLGMLEEARKHFGVPVTVMSGYRCPVHNKNVGGATHSQHLLGTAADIKVQGVKPSEVLAWADAMNPEGGVGGYNTFTHIDCRPGRARWGLRAKGPVPERSHVAKSTTLQATAATAVAGAGTVAAGVSELEGNTQIAVVVAGVVMLLALAWIARERIKAWGEGQR